MTDLPRGSFASRAGLFVLLGCMGGFAPLAMDMYLPAFPTIATDFSTSAAQVQLSLTGFMLGLAAGQFLAGPLSDVLGRRRPLLVGLALYSVASVACLFAPTVETFTAIRIVQGLTGAAAVVISQAIVRDRYEGVAGARFFSRLLLVIGTAPVVAPVIGGELLRVTSWRGIFVVLAAVGAAVFVASALGLRESLPPERRHAGGLRETGRTFRRLLGHREFVGYMVTHVAAGAAMFAYIAGSPFVLEGIYGVSPQLYGVLFGVLPAFFLVVATMGVTWPNALTLALADHPRAAGAGAAAIGGTFFLVGAVVAPLVGVAGKDTAVPLAIVIAIFEAAAFAALWIPREGTLWRRPTERELSVAAASSALPEATGTRW